MTKYFDLLFALSHIEDGSQAEKDNIRYQTVLIDTIADNQLAPPEAYTNEELPWYVHIRGSVFVLEWCGVALFVLILILVIYCFAKTAGKIEKENSRLRQINRENRNTGRSGGWGSDTSGAVSTIVPSAPADNSITINVARDLVLPPTYNDLLPSLNPELVNRFQTIEEVESADESEDAGNDTPHDNVRPYPLMLYPGCHHRCIEPVPQ